MFSDLRRTGRLLVVGSVLGLVLAGPLAYWRLDAFWTVSIPWILLAGLVVFASLVMYAVVEDIVEGLGVLLTVGVSVGISLSAILSIPALVAADMPSGAQAVIVQSAIFQAGILVAAVLLVLVLVSTLVFLVGVVTRTVKRRLTWRNNIPRVALILLGLLLLLSIYLGGTISMNYSSAAIQERAEVTVTDVRTEGQNVTLFLSVPNHLPERMLVESALIDITTADETRVSESAVFYTYVDPGETATLPIQIHQDRLSDGQTTTWTAEITGSVYISAFQDYDTELEIQPRMITCDAEC